MHKAPISTTLARLLCAYCILVSGAMAGIVQQETQWYGGSGTQAFSRYSPLPGLPVTSVTVELLFPEPASPMGYDNENDHEVLIEQHGRSYDITVDSTDVSFSAIHHVAMGIGSILILGPHDDPDGIDTLDAYQADSGNDWSAPLGVLPPPPVASQVFDPLDISTFLGTGTFDIDLVDNSGPIMVSLVPSGVSTTGGGVELTGYGVRVTMVAGPVPVAPTLLLCGFGLLCIRLLQHKRIPGYLGYLGYLGSE